MTWFFALKIKEIDLLQKPSAGLLHSSRCKRVCDYPSLQTRGSGENLDYNIEGAVGGGGNYNIEGVVGFYFPKKAQCTSMIISFCIINSGSPNESLLPLIIGRFKILSFTR
jgi:hypothetical protein